MSDIFSVFLKLSELPNCIDFIRQSYYIMNYETI